MFRADVHCHSTCSDGSDAPSALIDLAASLGLQGISITDHDSVEAYTPNLFAQAQEKEILLLVGVELSTELKGESVHVLGYGVQEERLRSFLEEMQKRRSERNKQILAKLAKKGILIEEGELPQQKVVGRPHIAELLVLKGVCRTWQEAFEVYLKDGASCYVPGIKYTPQEAIAKIHEAKGKAVLAHPHFLPRRFVQRELLSLPFDGIECYYGRLPKQQELPWLEIAKQKGWIATGGSDYHGKVKPHISLGCSWVDEAIFMKLLNP